MALGNMRNHLCIIALYLLAVVSCTPDLGVGTPFVEGQEVTLTASIADNPSGAKQMPGKQRVSGKDVGATIDLTWNVGDQILVSVGDKSAVFTLSSGENTSAGEFTGKMPADGNEYSVSYPVDYSDDVLTHQTYVENGFGNGLMKMSTRTNGTLEGGFLLSADNAVLGLQLTGSQTLGEIVLTNTATAKTYTLHCDGVVLTAEAILFYIVVPVKDWANGMRVEVYDNDGDIILMKEKAGEIMFSATDAMVMPALQTRERGKRIGIFSVGEGKYVSFSQGNLQYIQSTKTWQFAENQQEYIGAANVNGGALADKIDLFGWSANNTTAPFGISTSINNADYAGEFVDWGINWIGGDAPHTWRTLSIDEWKYLYHERENADKLFALGTINGIAGMILLPDDWQLPEGVTYELPTANGLVWDDNYNGGGYINRNTQANHYQDNIYTIEQWQVMEQADAVFLPAAGFREKTDFSNKSTTPPSDNVGSYATSTMSDQNNYYFMRFIHREVRKYNYVLHRGRAVRLVHDTIP